MTIECRQCGADMIHLCAADHRCPRCGFTYIADWTVMTLIDATLCTVSRETADCFPGFVQHLVDLCSGAVVAEDDDPNQWDLLRQVGLWHDVSCLDIVVWAHWRAYLADLADSMHADEFGIVLEAA